MSRRIYGWGIVDKLGEPFWDESCVCDDKGPMLDQVKELNLDRDARAPYRVVRLYYQGKQKKRIRDRTTARR